MGGMATPPPPHPPPHPPPPPPRASQPGYGPNFTPPSTSTPRPEKRATPPPFSSPVAARVSAQEEDGGGSASGSPVPQFSTPPGPPVFGSSLRPAAVPFTPSPAAPPPPPFFSPSSLPTSSPPHFSNNGLHGPRSHHPTALDDLNAAAPYVLFSAHKVGDRRDRLVRFILKILVHYWYPNNPPTFNFLTCSLVFISAAVICILSCPIGCDRLYYLIFDGTAYF